MTQTCKGDWLVLEEMYFFIGSMMMMMMVMMMMMIMLVMMLVMLIMMSFKFRQKNHASAYFSKTPKTVVSLLAGTMAFKWETGVITYNPYKWS